MLSKLSQCSEHWGGVLRTRILEEDLGHPGPEIKANTSEHMGWSSDKIGRLQAGVAMGVIVINKGVTCRVDTQGHECRRRGLWAPGFLELWPKVGG